MAKRKAVKKTPKKATAAPKKARGSKAAAKTSKKVPKKAAKPMIKRVPKKTPLVTASRKPRRQIWLPYVILAAAAILIIVGVILIVNSGDASTHTDSEVAAYVHGEPILMDDVEKQFAMLPPQYKSLYTKERVLLQLVDEEIVIQYGESLGFEATPEEVRAEIDKILANELTIEELQENLDTFNMTIEEFEGLIARKLIIEQTMLTLFNDLPEPTDQDARDFYDNNKQLYQVDEQVRVRHILISSQRDDAAQLGKELKERIEDGEDFCPLVEEYTDDMGSKENCGEYTFARGFMVPQFEEASFSMAPGEVTMVQTQFGYHVIEKLEDLAPTLTPFEDVKDQIKGQLYQQAQTQVYTDFMTEQKAGDAVQILYVEEAEPAE